MALQLVFGARFGFLDPCVPWGIFCEHRESLQSRSAGSGISAIELGCLVLRLENDGGRELQLTIHGLWRHELMVGHCALGLQFSPLPQHVLSDQ